MEAQIIAAELKKIEDRKGRLTPDAVVEAAKDAEHPLHGEFQWDDSIAGHQYRVLQARQLIGSVRVVFEVDHQKISTVAYLRDPSVSHGEQGYRSTAKLARDVDDARAAIVAEFSRAASHLRRARDLATALGHASEISDLVERVMRLDQRVREPEQPQAQ